MRSSVNVLKVLAVLSGIVAILVNLGAIVVGIFFALMLGASPGDTVVSLWQTLSLGKYFFNAFCVIFCFFSLNSINARRYYPVFLVPAGLFAIWCALDFPHLLAYFYFAFWVIYALLLVLNREQDLSGDNGEGSGQDSAREGA